MKLHTSGQRLKCKKCNLVFESDVLKKAHMKTHTSHLCNFCGKTFKRPCLLKSHLETHRDENDTPEGEEAGNGAKQENTKREFKCTFCKVDHASISRLKQHMHKEHAELGNKCGECANIFFSKRGLTDHMKIHSTMNKLEESITEGDSIDPTGDEVFYEIPLRNTEVGDIILDIGDLQVASTDAILYFEYPNN